MEDFQWYVLRVKAGLDDRAEEGLTREGFRVYRAVGVKSVIHRRYRVKLTKHFTLFPGYLFIAMDGRSNWMKANSCNGVVGALGYDGLPYPVPKGYVEKIQSAEQAGEFDFRIPDDPKSAYSVGSKVMIIEGAFKGMKASIHSLRGKSKVQAIVDWFKSASLVELPVGSIKLAV